MQNNYSNINKILKINHMFGNMRTLHIEYLNILYWFYKLVELKGNKIKMDEKV